MCCPIFHWANPEECLCNSQAAHTFWIPPFIYWGWIMFVWSQIVNVNLGFAIVTVHLCPCATASKLRLLFLPGAGWLPNLSWQSVQWAKQSLAWTQECFQLCTTYWLPHGIEGLFKHNFVSCTVLQCKGILLRQESSSLCSFHRAGLGFPGNICGHLSQWHEFLSSPPTSALC